MSRFSGHLYDIRSLSFDLLLACVSMLSKLALFMVCLSFCLKWVCFSCLLLFHVEGYILVSSFFHLEVPWGFWVGCQVCCLAFFVVVDSVVIH